MVIVVESLIRAPPNDISLATLRATPHSTHNTRIDGRGALPAPFQKRFKWKNCRGEANGHHLVESHRIINCKSSGPEEYGLGRDADSPSSIIELPGGKMVVELVAAWNNLTERMAAVSNKSSQLLLKTLKISIPLLQGLPLGQDGRSPLSRAVSVACILADLQVEAEVIAAALLRELLEVGAVSRHEVKTKLGSRVTHLLHDCVRVKKIPKRVDTLDDDHASTLRKFCLAYHDIRAVIVELAVRLDMMRHSKHLPRYHRQTLALEVMQIYAPLAHAIGTGNLSSELEDLAFQFLFPNSYSFVDTWLRSQGTSSKCIIDEYRCQLLEALQRDNILQSMVDDISVQGRYKSRFSTMKKLLRDGRKLQEVYDVLGLRVVLNPRPGEDVQERGVKACYRTREIIQALWKEMPQRMKDYIAKPKENGYESLHLAVDLSNSDCECPVMEIQIRTTEMDGMAIGGSASHALYKGGLTDVEQVRQLKAIMMTAADLAALHFQDHSTRPHKGSPMYNDLRNQVFKLFDKNEDGLISMEELREVMEELGADKSDAQELMQLMDVNSDGSLSSDEFAEFERQVRIFRKLEDIDEQYSSQLGCKLHSCQSGIPSSVNEASKGNSSVVVETINSNTTLETHDSATQYLLLKNGALCGALIAASDEVDMGTLEKSLDRAPSERLHSNKKQDLDSGCDLP